MFTVRFAQYRVPQLTLKPLFFEVPLQEPDPLFLGRHWLIREMEESLGSASPGVLISGSPGTGKSALILQLVDYSCFGRRRDPTYQQGKCTLLRRVGRSVLRFASSGSRPISAKILDRSHKCLDVFCGFLPIVWDSANDKISALLSAYISGSVYLADPFVCNGKDRPGGSQSIYCQISLVSERIRHLASHVVAYHFCQVSTTNFCLFYSVTCSSTFHHRSVLYMAIFLVDCGVLRTTVCVCLISAGMCAYFCPFCGEI